jgi:hypothetical protein
MDLPARVGVGLARAIRGPGFRHRDPSPIVESPRRLGRGCVHADLPAGWQRRRHCSPCAPRPAFSGQTLRAYSPGRACYSRELATFSSSHRAKLCALPPLCGSACHPEERRRAADSAGQTVVAPRRSSDRADLIPNGMRPIGLAPERGVTSVCAGQGLYSWAWLDLNQRPHPYQVSRTQRCADRRFPRSHGSVGGEGMRSYSPAPDRRTDTSAWPPASI